MKTIAQLLQLKKNPYYQFTPEEQEALNAFLETQSEESQDEKNSTNSSKKTHVIVHNKNIVPKETGYTPTI